MSDNDQSIEKPQDQPRIKLLIDFDSENPDKTSVHVEGNCGVLADLLVQVFEHPNNKGLVSVFEIAVNDYYAKHPEEYDDDSKQN